MAQVVESAKLFKTKPVFRSLQPKAGPLPSVPECPLYARLQLRDWKATTSRRVTPELLKNDKIEEEQGITSTTHPRTWKEGVSRRKKEGVIMDFYGVSQKIRTTGP